MENSTKQTGIKVKTRKTGSQSQCFRGLSLIFVGRQIEDKWKTAEDIQKKPLRFLSSMSSMFLSMEDSCRPRIYWLSSMSSLSSRKTAGTTPSFDHLKTTKAPVLLGFIRFSHAQNVQKEVVYD